MGDIATNFNYGVGAEAIEFDGNNKYIRITDIDEKSGKFLPSKLTSPSFGIEEKYVVKENDILLARTGASVGKSYLYNKEDGILYFAGFLIRINLNEEYSRYVYQYLQTDMYWNFVKVTSARSGQPGINSKEYGELKILLYKSDVNLKISNFLSSIDILIEKQERYIKYLKEKKITSSKIILESNNTVKIKLCDMIERYSEKNKLNDLVPVAVGKYGIRKRDEIYSKELSSNYSQNKVIYQNTLTFGMGSKQIDFGILLTSDIYCVSPAYNTFKIKTDVINPYYLNELLSLNIKKLSAMFMITSARQGKAVEFDGLLNYYFDILPNIKEQNKIELLLSSMDKLIEFNEKKIRTIKVKKKVLFERNLQISLKIVKIKKSN